MCILSFLVGVLVGVVCGSFLSALWKTTVQVYKNAKKEK